MTERLDWNRTWISVAKVMSLRSACTLAQVGAVIVNDKNRIIATGYNGPPANSIIKESCELSCPRSHDNVQGTSYGFGCLSIHAEANALLFCDRSLIEGGSLYVNAVPCEDCSKLIANSGIAYVYFVDDHKPHRPSSVIHDYLAQHNIISETL